MRVISLNTWGGRLIKELLAFIKNEASQTDIFCFQEVFDSTVSQHDGILQTDLFTVFAKTLPDFQGYFAPAIHGQNYQGPTDVPLAFGLAIFVRRALPVIEQGDIFVYGERNQTHTGDHQRNLQYVCVQYDEREHWILNLHGFHNEHKSDCPERIEQSKRTVAFVKLREHVVLCGDFNLRPETQSIAILEEQMHNLIKGYHITETRTELYKKAERYADYTLVKNIHVKHFDIPKIVVSDHLPMILEF